MGKADGSSRLPMSGKTSTLSTRFTFSFDIFHFFYPLPVKQSLTAAGSAQWTPNLDRKSFEDHISSLLKTPKLVKTMSLHTQLAVQATAQAAPEFSCPPARRGLIVCQSGDLIDHSELLPHFYRSEQKDYSYASAARRTPPLWLLHQLPNMTAAHLAREWTITGPAHSFSQAELPTEQGILTATLLFEAGDVDELLLVAVARQNLPKGNSCHAAVWHLRETPDTDFMENLTSFLSSTVS